jgi:hypothetical protein
MHRQACLQIVNKSRSFQMALLKRKGERTSVASIRLPISAVQELHALRKLADDKGYDLNASMADALLKWLKQAREELGFNGDPGLTEINAKGRRATSSDIISVEQTLVTAGSNGTPTDRRV